jgi:hypothetical protein
MDGRASTGVGRGCGGRDWMWDVPCRATGSDCLGEQGGKGKGDGRFIYFVSVPLSHTAGQPTPCLGNRLSRIVLNY